MLPLENVLSCQERHCGSMCLKLDEEMGRRQGTNAKDESLLFQTSERLKEKNKSKWEECIMSITYSLGV